jgi:hypothetical protein
MSKKTITLHAVQFERPLGSLGAVIAELQEFVEKHPNPTEGPRTVTFRVAPAEYGLLSDGPLIGFTVTDGETE